ncbi:hypothetical protein HPB51_000775 [Rhipicephalus microplus]|uniref:Uncharacterized protein n=1 Tax=Rhipicephalus microplus TaxID=6941 RepID=A0A9J6EQ53_RHIMP|nr:hypothetical protein HPB51_000775 [Rhipicephalus microplus]
MPKRAPLKTLDGPRIEPSAQTADPVMSKSCITGTILNYRSPCTGGEGRLCHIFRDLPIWNEYFTRVNLALREFSAGELSLVETRCPQLLSCPRFDLVEREWRHEAATLLHQLLTQHRCLVSVELNEHMLSGSPEPIAQICDALSSGTTLRKLTLSLPFRPSWICPWYHARPVYDGCMSPHHFDTYSEGPYTRLDHSFLKGFADFLAITRSLTTLDISQLPLLESNAGDIFRRLKGNTTVTTLSVNTLILSPYVSRNDVGFADYMLENRTLQSLSVTALAEHARRDFTWLIGALFTRNTLSELNMIQFRLNMEMHKLIASHLERIRH